MEPTDQLSVKSSRIAGSQTFFNLVTEQCSIRPEFGHRFLRVKTFTEGLIVPYLPYSFIRIVIEDGGSAISDLKVYE